MTLVEIVRLLALGGTLLYGLSLIGLVPALLKHKKLLLRLSFLAGVLVVIGEPALQGWRQYQMWVGQPGTRGLVTGEQSGFIYMYTFGRFALWRWIGGVTAAIVYWLSVRFIVKPSDGFKLNRDEALLIAIGIALAGWPGFVLYMMTLLLLYVGILTVRTVGGGGEARFSVALPATISLITIPFIQQFLVWASSAFGINFLLYNVTNLSL